MLVIPAIDLLQGKPVRLRQGDFQRVIDVAGSPLELARTLAEAGAPWLHLVDLDGARAGSWQQLDVIAQIAASVEVPVQAGGGARTETQIEAALARGIARVIVGTAAAETPEQAAAWCRRYGERLAISLDSHDGRLLTRGWMASSGVEGAALASQLAAAGAACFISTDVRRDGMLQGIDAGNLGELLRLGVPVLVAGGVATYEDLERLRDAGAAGAIVGRALLEGRLDLKRAMRAAAGSAPQPGGSFSP